MHRRIKDAFCASADPDHWVKRQPFIVININNAMRSDGQVSPAEIVFGSQVQLPADISLVLQTERRDYNAADYADILRTRMQSVRPIHTKHNQPKFVENYGNPKFATATKVLLKNEAKKRLQANYIGPFKVLARNDNHYVIERGKIAETIAIHCLKHALNLRRVFPN